MRPTRLLLVSFAFCLLLSACSDMPEGEQDYPIRKELERNQSRGKITGDGLSIGGEDEKDDASNPLGVNSFLWRATLDTLAFMPLVSADPWGGTIITDWYEDPQARGERFKATALILDRQLRADGVKISLFKQSFKDGKWNDEKVDAKLERELEDTVLTRARQLRIKQSAQ